MMELILIRHGRTGSNIRKAYCGHTDAELDEEGVRQAEAAAEGLRGTRLDGIYTSPLKRAYRTAEIVNRHHGLRLETSESLMEQNFGLWEDFTYDEICGRYPEDAKRWNDDWKNFCMERGESPAQVYERTAGFLEALAQRHKTGTFLIVTHLGCIRHMLSRLLGMGIEGFWRFWADNCAIIRVVVDDTGFAYLSL